MGLRTYARTPVLLVLLVVLPAYAIGVFRWVAPETAVALHLASGETVTAVGVTDAIGALMVPLSCAFVGGFAGLFVMQTTRNGDRRLVLSGYRPSQVVAARLSLLCVVGGMCTLISVVTLIVAGFTPELLGWFALGTLLTALVYGCIGALLGSVLDTLSSVYLLLFGPMIDLFLFQNPLARETSVGAGFLPGHFPLALVMDSAFTAQVSGETVVGSLAVLGGLAAVAAGAFYRSMR